jgi:DnaJ-class molecular chaperone
MATRDPYKVLGLSKGASTAEIKKAYRALAKKHHPDTNKGDDAAARKFSEVSAAHDLLIDDEKRGQFDRGEIDADGNPTHKGFNPFGGGGQGAGPFRRWSSQGGGAGPGGFNPEDIFADIFGNMGPGGGAHRAATGPDVSYTLKVTFIEAAKGGPKRISMPNGKTLDVNIPAGVIDGQQIRLRGQGGASPSGAPSGDALITIAVAAHPLFERAGDDIKLDLPVTLYEAVLGARIRVPTLEGSVQVKIPPNSSSGKTLRLKGKGVAAKGHTGDLLVTLRIMLPESGDEAIKTLAEEMQKSRPYSVRGDRFGNNS